MHTIRMDVTIFFIAIAVMAATTVTLVATVTASDLLSQM